MGIITIENKKKSSKLADSLLYDKYENNNYINSSTLKKVRQEPLFSP